MRVLFVMAHAGFVRNFEHLVRELSGRGHEVVLAFEHDDPPWLAGFDAAAHVGVRATRTPRRSIVRRAPVAAVRRSLDYLRFLEPEFAETPGLRRRAGARIPAVARAVASSRLRRPLHRLLRSTEQRLPRGYARTFLEAESADIVLVSPLVGLGSSQVDFVRAAREAGLPSCLLVASWDNLTTKAAIREVPDLVVVWNDTQRDEAVRLHGVPDERIVVAGAHSWDHWFGWEPSRSRKTLRSAAGLPGDGPYVLYVCSSEFIAPNELAFVERWAAAVRRSGIEASLLVRPHPQNAVQWRERPPTLSDVAVWPQHGAPTVDDERRADYFDSLYHAAAGVGANTSALLESALVGRPALTMLADEFRETQESTLHFGYLRQIVHIAHDLEEHVEQLRAAIAGEADDDERRLAFVESFARPHGLDAPATPRVADAIEALRRYARNDPSPSRRGN